MKIAFIPKLTKTLYKQRVTFIPTGSRPTFVCPGLSAPN